MSQELEELFGEGSGSPEPQVRLVATLLGVGVLLAIAGMACTAAPGGIVVLLAWMVVEKDIDRLETGYLPAEESPNVHRMRMAALISLGVIIVLFALQLMLFCGGVYEHWWGQAITAYADWSTGG